MIEEVIEKGTDKVDKEDLKHEFINRMEEMEEDRRETFISQLRDAKISRRNFMKILGIGAGGLALSSTASGASWGLFQPLTSGTSDVNADQLDGFEASQLYRPISFKFGSEGSSTTSTSYTVITDSDIAFNPDNWKVNNNLYIRIYAHLKNDTGSEDTFARVYRQNAGTAVSGTEVSVTGAGFGFADSGWVDLSGDTGSESYQIQLKVTGGTGIYNSITMLLSPIQTF
ncbi:MAG: twin-arginine translocation signal domain-containing protein [Candidatus Nanohaloarchaea archaeon]|nr:twin-arginine translocation signal domain-containing protein [Candidatus Nanohaloarchaea archaeon]